jgi:hypothetical protein
VILGTAAGGVTQTTSAPMPPLVIQSLTGRDPSDFYCATCHGRDEMPVWGPVFLGLDRPETLVKVRIANVVDYVASLQVK